MIKNHNALLLFLFFSVSVFYGQKYKAGFTSIKLIDSSRVYKADTKVSDSLHLRPVDLDIWYPSDQEGDKPLSFGDLFKLFEQRAIAYQDSTDYSGLTEELAQYYVAELGIGTDGQQLLNINTSSFSNLAISQGKHPVIFYMAGFNGMGFENYKVLEGLTSSGFVVVSIGSVGRYPGDMTNEMEDMMEQVYDAEFALNYLRLKNVFDIDDKNMGVLGCSWGGMSAAVLVNRNPEFKAMVSFDGTETHYFGELDDNVYANGATGDENDGFIQAIYEADLLRPENQNLSYLYLESGDKLDEFTPTYIYDYYKKLKSEKRYLRYTNSEHADFTCIPSILNASEISVNIYKNIEALTVGFFNKALKGFDDFDSIWASVNELDYTTDQAFEIGKKEILKASVLAGEIIDTKTKEPLAYVNIGIANKETGTVSDTRGRFSLLVNQKFANDTLRISMIGYKPKDILIKNLEFGNGNLMVEMEERINVLDEIILGAKGVKRKTLGNKTESKFIGAGFGYKQLGAEMGIKINIPNRLTQIEAFNFTISHNRLSATSIFRLNIYSVRKGKPFENILNNNIFVKVEPKQVGLISVDLEPYNIVLNEDIIVTLEWVETQGENNKGEAIFFPLGLFTSGTLHKESSQSRFKKFSSFGVGFNLDVRF